jgi:hypothetical protein
VASTKQISGPLGAVAVGAAAPLILDQIARGGLVKAELPMPQPLLQPAVIRPGEATEADRPGEELGSKKAQPNPRPSAQGQE